MQQFVEFEEVRRLLLDPTPANVAAAQVKLEAVAAVMRGVVRSVEAGVGGDASIRHSTIALRQDLLRVRSLLENAAKFFNSMSSLRFQAVYKGNGCLYAEPGALRTLAQL